MYFKKLGFFFVGVGELLVGFENVFVWLIISNNVRKFKVKMIIW